MKQEVLTPDRESELTAMALDGYLATVEEPHTRLMPSRYFQDRQKAGAKSFSGIGVSFRGIRHGIVVQRVLEGGPAERAGMAVNDILVQIDGEKVRRGPSVEEATRKIEGPEGSTLLLTVRRKGMLHDFHLTRRKLATQNVTVGTISRSGHKWGYVRIGDFVTGHPCDETREGIRAVTAAGAKGLVLDLRNNPGGFVTEAVCVAGLFLDPGKVVVTLRPLPNSPLPSQGEQVRRTPTGVPQFTALPMVTLVMPVRQVPPRS